MAYRDDSDLEFLETISSSDLDALVAILSKGTDGKDRLTEELTGHEDYKIFYPDHNAYWELIAAEIQCFGANSFATILRGGQGVLYKEVLVGACDKMKVNFSKNASIEVIETNLLMKILTESMNGMSPDDLKRVAEDLELDTTNFTAESVIIALQGAIKLNGFATYRVALIVANAVAKAILGRGLSLGVNAGLARTIGIFAGPIGWLLTGLWTMIDIAGPAYRVTIPAVIQVAFLRAKTKFEGAQA